MSDLKPPKLPPLPLILTGNDLLDGHVVYWTGKGWSPDLAEAEVARTPEAGQALNALIPGSEAEVAEPYVVTAALDESGHPVPAHFREGFRVSGPTIAYGREAVA